MYKRIVLPDIKNPKIVEPALNALLGGSLVFKSLKESKTDHFNFAVELKDNSQPKTFKPRKIVFLYTDKVESQIKQLLQHGVL